MTKVQEPFTVTIEDIIADNGNVMNVNLCDTCDEVFVEFCAYDMDIFLQQVTTVTMCEKCNTKSSLGEIPVDCLSYSEEVDVYRKGMGMTTLEESRNDFQRKSFNSFLKFEGNYEEWHTSNLSSDTTLQELEDIYFHITGSKPKEETKHETLYTKVYDIINGYSSDTEGAKEVHPDDWDRDEHLKDLMILRYAELGSSYYS